MIKRIINELTRHAPFTAIGSGFGIALMVILVTTHASQALSAAFFHTLHPLHVILSAVVTTSMYRLHGSKRIIMALVIGYTGSIGIATLSDTIIPFLGSNMLGVPMELHLPFIETEPMPGLGIPTWVAINLAAVIGIFIGYFRPATRFPHFGHVLLSTWASLFAFTAFTTADWINRLPLLFVFLFLAVWLPCCVSDIIYPMVWGEAADTHHH
ncbi:hypothetical protein ACFLYV_00690 [Chloroflexota bacterium]